jgi:hypothetical protein
MVKHPLDLKSISLAMEDQEKHGPRNGLGWLIWYEIEYCLLRFKSEQTTNHESQTRLYIGVMERLRKMGTSSILDIPRLCARN